jgi:hypothetical protein
MPVKSPASGVILYYPVLRRESIQVGNERAGSLGWDAAAEALQEMVLER